MSDQKPVKQGDTSFNFTIIKLWYMVSVRAPALHMNYMRDDVRCACLAAPPIIKWPLTILASPMPWRWSQIACTKVLEKSVVRCLVLLLSRCC